MPTPPPVQPKAAEPTSTPLPSPTSIADRRSNSAACAHSAACADLDGSRHVDHRSHDCPNDNAHVSSTNLDPVAHTCSTDRYPIADAGYGGGHRDAPQDV